jgi:hypothetical protein
MGVRFLEGVIFLHELIDDWLGIDYNVFSTGRVVSIDKDL